MTTTDTTTRTTSDAAVRPADVGRAPRTGLLNGRFLTIELRRLLRNRRTVIFTLVMPPAFFLIFGASATYRHQSVGHGNVTAFIMVSMALYGAMLATTGGGASVSVERAQGWTRQLRLTPLRPATYVTTKVLVAMVLGLAAVVVVGAVGLAEGATGNGGALVWSLLLAWAGSVVTCRCRSMAALLAIGTSNRMIAGMPTPTSAPDSGKKLGNVCCSRLSDSVVNRERYTFSSPSSSVAIPRTR